MKTHSSDHGLTLKGINGSDVIYPGEQLQLQLQQLHKNQVLLEKSIFVVVIADCTPFNSVFNAPPI
jgi:hypothetical protein